MNSPACIMHLRGRRNRPTKHRDERKAMTLTDPAYSVASGPGGISRAVRVVAMFIVLLGTLAACGDSTPDPTTAVLTLRSTTQINPNASGQPAPVVVRIYELKATSIFDSAEFTELFYSDQATLGGDMLGRKEIEIAPGQQLDQTVTLSGETRFIGFVAGYRDLTNATWRGKIAIEPEEENSILITVDALSINAKIPEGSWWNIF